MRIRQAIYTAACALGCVALPLFAQPIQFPEPNYCFSFLNAAPNRADLPEKEVMEIQKQHLAHLGALWQKGWLEAAGPILTPGGPRGILISNCKSAEEANEMASADPAVQNKRLTVESYRWAGPAGIGQRYRKTKADNPEAKENMVKRSLVLLRKSADWRDWPPKEVLEAHIAHMMGLMKTERVLAGGPFRDGGPWVGVIVLADKPLADARRLIEQDPMVLRGFATVEAYEWLVADNVFPEQ